MNGRKMEVSCKLSAISYQLSAISYQLSAISYQLSAISYQNFDLASLFYKSLLACNKFTYTGEHLSETECRHFSI
ncbi:hypothetical protein AUR67_14270 [Pseudoalteromonas sp. XI10]|nr:hypothetical protein AUR67_14270 [Pseudoalteromonas sp. XI10]